MSADDRFEGGCATLTARQREARNARVFADRARGLSWTVIAERHCISERQGRRIVDAYVARQPPPEFDPGAAVRELLAHFEQAIEDLALLSVDANSDAVRLGAITRRLELVERRIMVLRSLNLLPRNWGRWMEVQGDRLLFKRLVDFIGSRPDVPSGLVDELLAELDRMPDAVLSPFTTVAA